MNEVSLPLRARPPGMEEKVNNSFIRQVFMLWSQHWDIVSEHLREEFYW